MEGCGHDAKSHATLVVAQEREDARLETLSDTSWITCGPGDGFFFASANQTGLTPHPQPLVNDFLNCMNNAGSKGVAGKDVSRNDAEKLS